MVYTQCQNCGELTPKQAAPLIGGKATPNALPAGTVVTLAGGERVMLMHATLVEALEIAHA